MCSCLHYTHHIVYHRPHLHGVQKKNIEEQYINTENKPTISNIQDDNQRFDQGLISKVDNHMSWSILKNNAIKSLNEDEQKLFAAAEKQEDFWKKHLWKGELETLAFTGSAALLLGLIAAFAFEATGGVLAALILTPIGAGALFVAPIVASISQKSAIVDNMINISNQNKEFNNNLKQGEEKYKQYKEKNQDFIKFLQSKSEPEKGKDIKEEENIININPEQKNKIISKEDKSNEKINPLNMVNGVNQHDGNNTGKNNKENEEEKKEP